MLYFMSPKYQSKYSIKDDVIMTSYRLAVDAIRGLHPGVVTMALNNALWSQEEEAYLSKIPSVRFYI